jgi:uncharacterized protein YdeI (BOF family)
MMTALAAFLFSLCSLTFAQQQSTPGADQAPQQTQPDAQSAPSQQPPDQPAPPPGRSAGQTADPGAQAQPSDNSGVQTFVGTIVKQGNKYVFQDTAGTTYDVDHQDQVKNFEGKRVRMRGVLDPSGKMIRIQ